MAWRWPQPMQRRSPARSIYLMNYEHCIRCTICVENCPVFRVNPDFPGP
ncbi:MAG TPA: hypothetical protein DCR81_06040, partial [Smithella sp.]|nr:hypothetical protein [Smithella sp.]